MNDKHIKEFDRLNQLNSNAPSELKQERGRHFETLINEIFDEEKILLKRSYFTSDNRSEQIDCAIEIYNRIFLIEVKWVESGIAASELYAFLGKIENKFQGTLGVFISREKLSENFINSLNKGRRQSIIVIHGEDIDLIFSQKLSFSDYLVFTFKILSFDNIVHFSVEEYLKIYQSKPSAPTPDYKESVINFIQKILLKEDSSNELLLEMEKQSVEEKDLTFKYVINQYSTIWYNGIKERNLVAIKNFDNYLKLYKPTEKEKLILLTKTYYKELINKSIDIYSREQFIELFSPYFSLVADDDKSFFENLVLKYWENYFDNYDKENQLTNITKPIWEYLSPNIKDKLAHYYLDIFISSRHEKFPQKKFAIHLLNNNLIKESIIIDWLSTKLIESKASYKELNSDNISFISYTYASIAKYLKIDLNEWTMFIDEKIRKLK